MRQSVLEAWPEKIRHWEGVCYWMYLDTKEKVTTGTGNLIDSVAAAEQLPWLRLDGKPASVDEINVEWQRVKKLVQFTKFAGTNRVWSDSAKLRLSQATVDKLLNDVTNDFVSHLESTLAQFELFPADAQLAIMDEAWQNGKYYLDPGTNWIDTRNAVLAQDWAAAAVAVPRSGDRAEYRKRLFMNAATVVSLGGDPDILWDTKTPTAPSEEIMHSNKWNSDYVLFRGGYFPPITATKLKSIPSYANVVQGGLSFAKASAMTHAGLGTGDLSVRGLNKDQVWKLCTELWEVDIIPCPRGFVADSFQGPTIGNIHDGNEHIHFLDLDAVKSMHPQAQAQVREVLAGGDGLLGNAHYTGPSISHKQKWKDSQYNPANVKNVRGVWYVVANSLVGNDVNRHQVATKKKGDSVGFQKQVKRWGRWNCVDSSNHYWAISVGKQTFLSPTNPHPPTPPAPPKPPAGFKPGRYHSNRHTGAHKQPTTKSPIDIWFNQNLNIDIVAYAGFADGHHWGKDKVRPNCYWILEELTWGPNQPPEGYKPGRYKANRRTGSHKTADLKTPLTKWVDEGGFIDVSGYAGFNNDRHWVRDKSFSDRYWIFSELTWAGN